MPKGEYTDGKVKVTVRLEPELVRRAKIFAIDQRTTLQAVIEETLKHVVGRGYRVPPPAPTARKRK